MYKEFGYYLRVKRGDSSLREFASQLNISHTQLESLEKNFEIRTGKIPNITINLLKKICSGLGITVAEGITFFEDNASFVIERHQQLIEK